MQARAHILPLIALGVGGTQGNEEMPETHTPQVGPVGTLIVPVAGAAMPSERLVSHLRLAWTHSANELFELIS